MVGPFMAAKDGLTHIFVAVDKFTKWIEDRPVEFITEITRCFGAMNNIIRDKGTQFTAWEFTSFYDLKGIKVHYASVAPSQSNGQVERVNGMILQGLKPIIFRLKPYAVKWMKELPSVLWGLRTTPSRATGESPLKL